MTSETNLQFAPSGQLMNTSLNSGPSLTSQPNLLSNTFSPISQSSSNNQPSSSGSILQQLFSLKLSNVPSDLSEREAQLIFALVNDDITSVELKDQVITAVFKTLNTCITTGKLLERKPIFGGNMPHVNVEYDANVTMATTSNAFNNMRLSNSGISPPSSHSITLISNPAPGSLSGQQVPQGSFGSFQKRKSVGNQRSRFLFSDPFSGAATPANANAPAGSIDLSDITGKSILMMESHNDAREYENLVRDPWSSQGQNSLGFGSAPDTPGINVTNAFEWGVSSSGQHSQQAPQSQQAQQAQQSQPQSQQQQQQSGQQGNVNAQQTAQVNAGNSQSSAASGSLNGERRRTSSAFFSNGSGTHPQSQSGNQAASQQQPQTVAAILSQGPTQSNGNLAPLSIPPNSTNRTGPLSASSSSGTQQTVSSSQTNPNAATTPTSAARPSTKDVPDLSLLARVPPPANPADQNPPCNTLYVGNLPPDATENELRTLFSPQKGFRRLSFRTKNQSSNSNSSSSSHNHGPMCFVEFEDVAHATIALAELYGRALPRPNGSNGKGGIRLSFSKNPLGVRGPGNPRRFSSQQTSNSGTTGTAGNFGYQNFH